MSQVLAQVYESTAGCLCRIEFNSIEHTISIDKQIAGLLSPLYLLVHSCKHERHVVGWLVIEPLNFL